MRAFFVCDYKRHLIDRKHAMPATLKPLSMETRFFLLFLAGMFVGYHFYWYPGIFSPFQFDDHASLAGMHVTNFTELKTFVFGGHSGQTGRPLALLTFLINDSQWPAFAPDFKRTNLLLHCLTTLVVFVLIRSILRLFCDAPKATGIACLSTGLWFLSPMHASTVLYVVQRMTILAALWGLLAIVCYHKLRVGLGEWHKGKSLSVSVYLILGITCFVCGFYSKESVVSLLYVIPVIELCIYAKTRPLGVSAQRTLNSLLILTAVMLVLYQLLNIDVYLRSYEARDYTLSGKLALYPVFLGHYAQQFFSLTTDIPSLFKDNLYDLYIGNTQIIAIAWFGLLAVIALAWRVRHAAPLLTVGLLWFVLMHLVEGGPIPIEPYFEHRNYLPSVGLILAFAGAWVFCWTKARFLMSVFSVLLFALSVTLGSISIATWSNFVLLGLTWSTQAPESVRAQRYFSHTLEVLGSPLNALKAENYVARTFDKAFGAHLNVLRLNCEVGFNNSGALTRLEERVQRGYPPRKNMFGGVQAFEKFIEVGWVNCFENAAQRTRFLQAMEKVEAAPTIRRDRLIATRYYQALAKSYLSVRQFERAMENLDKAIALKPSVALLRERTIWLMSAGLYELAAESVDRAIEIAQQEGKHALLDELEFLKHIIQGNIFQQTKVSPRTDL